MAEDESGSASPSEKTTATEKTSADSDVAKWIKNIAAIVTVLTAISGIAFSAYQLKLKAETDRKTAELNELAERDKLQLGHDQLADLGRARLEQAGQHKEDNSLELTKHQLDNQRLVNALADEDLRESRKRLSELITHMFGHQGPAEGDLASLFEYLNRDDDSKQIIENAVLARLASPVSQEEVDLGFRVLEKIGYPAIDITIQANRNARQKFDECLFADFYSRAVALGLPKDPAQRMLDFDTTDPIEKLVAASTSLNARYVYATINRIGTRDVTFYVQLPFSPPNVRCPQPYMAFVITRSNNALASQFRSYLTLHRSVQPEDKSKFKPALDLSSTYLTNVFLQEGEVIMKDFKLDLSNAYAGFDRYTPFALIDRYKDHVEDSKLLMLESTPIGFKPRSEDKPSQTNFESLYSTFHPVKITVK